MGHHLHDWIPEQSSDNESKCKGEDSESGSSSSSLHYWKWFVLSRGGRAKEASENGS